MSLIRNYQSPLKETEKESYDMLNYLEKDHSLQRLFFFSFKENKTFI